MNDPNMITILTTNNSEKILVNRRKKNKYEKKTYFGI